MDKPRPRLSACPQIASVQPLGAGVAFLIIDEHGALECAAGTLAEAGVLAGPEPAQPTLEDALILLGTRNAGMKAKR